ncbi:DUF805 domain-containing protein [Acinetobacter sp. CFCC 10889]|uniref:DUF805 domain-containing protein n=1 Tax=Acinetobacter sp. CFCC 10889 TaxID=1775557 RepID=UPI000DD0461F|nr:DUF805 domain-containing protein [Acinetobacter sp. CFCC 10889]
MNNNIQSSDSGLSANGRFGRLSYLAWNMLLGFFVMLCGVLAAFIVPSMMTSLSSGTSPSLGLFVPIILIYIILIYCTYIFAIRRLHDLNKTGWLSLVLLIPLIGLFFWIYISCAKGDEGYNNYGAPRLTRGWEKVLGWIYLIMIPLSLILMLAVGLPAYQSYVKNAEAMQMQIEQMQMEQASEYSE